MFCKNLGIATLETTNLNYFILPVYLNPMVSSCVVVVAVLVCR
jgi:hypothetical protein